MVFYGGLALGYPYRRISWWQDDFRAGAAGAGTNGSIGESGGHSIGGTLSYLQSETNHPGIIRCATTAVSGTPSGYVAFGQHYGMASGNTTWRMLAVVRLNTNDANTALRVGPMYDFYNATVGTGVFFEKLAGDTNWFCALTNSSTKTRVDSGVAVSTGWVTLAIAAASAVCRFYLNGTWVGTVSTNYPTTAMSPSVAIVNTAAADKTVDIDYLEVTQRVTR